jgi:hypothetical protein
MVLNNARRSAEEMRGIKNVEVKICSELVNLLILSKCAKPITFWNFNFLWSRTRTRKMRVNNKRTVLEKEASSMCNKNPARGHPSAIMSSGYAGMVN